MRKILYIFALAAVSYIVLTVITSCARMRQPDGGWYDEVPPRVLGASPAEHSTNVKNKKIEIRFSEFIKVENATENVVICPPQLEMPEIKTKGKVLQVELKDSLKSNTTYTIDFSDAIKDYNENNPMGNFTYTFSTGNVIDTLEVSGYVLEAETLEPVQGQLVGLYANTADSAFTTQPMLRIGRTDASGHFIIRGIAPGDYRIYSLMDQDNNFMLTRGEALAFSKEIITPSCMPDVRQDTTWIDSLHIGSIDRVGYTHYLPDNICLRSYTPKNGDRYLIKTERKEPDRFGIYFSTGSEELPKMRALDFDDKDAYVIETSKMRDTLTYWLRDTALINKDTLTVEMTYMINDSTGALVSQTDTIQFLPKTPYLKRLKKKMEEIEKWEKKHEKDKKKRKKNDEEEDERPDATVLKPKIEIPTKMTPVSNVKLTFDTPLAKLDTAAIHLYSMIDSLWYISPVQVTSEGLPPRTYMIQGEWRPEVEYSLEIDSAAFVDIYGYTSKAYKGGIQVMKDEEFSSLFVNIRGVENDTAQVIVQLLDKSSSVKASAIAENGTAEFYYIDPGEYYISAIIDYNRNGKWDEGDYATGLPPEEVYYHHEKIECKAKWDLTTTFDVKARPLYRQKPAELVKNKAEKKKKILERNLKRARELEIPYDKEKVNSKF